jgi:hypothetical protein
MLDDLSASLNARKVHDLLGRLENRNTDAALGAEAELAMLWAVSRVADVTVEPDLSGTARRPDAFSENLFVSAPAIVEVRALSDDSFSGKEAMDRTANIIAGYADRVSKDAGRRLYFEFMERSYWGRRFHRERCVDPDFKLTPAIQKIIDQWLGPDGGGNGGTIHIVEGKTDVVVSYRGAPSPHFRVHCRMPPVAYDLEDNPIYKALKQKARQIRNAEAGTLKCVFLVDAGCDLLRRMRPISSAGQEVSGEEIIRHWLRKHSSIDLVCVFSPHREQQMWLAPESRIFWKVSCFDRRGGMPTGEYERLTALAAQLPPPRFEGYQARDLHRQGAFGPEKRGWYLAPVVTTGGGQMTIKISSRLVQEYLAGRLQPDEFKRHAFGNMPNLFENELTRGHTIQAARFETGGTDEDDDYLVFDLDFDWGAGSLTRQR